MYDTPTGVNRETKLHNGDHGQSIYMLGSKRWGGGSATTRTPDKALSFSDGFLRSGSLPAISTASVF